MNACIQCKYHIFPNVEQYEDWHECTHPDAAHPVTGDRFLCESVRTDLTWGVCGHEGKLFEPRDRV